MLIKTLSLLKKNASRKITIPPEGAIRHPQLRPISMATMPAHDPVTIGSNQAETELNAEKSLLK